MRAGVEEVVCADVSKSCVLCRVSGAELVSVSLSSSSSPAAARPTLDRRWCARGGKRWRPALALSLSLTPFPSTAT